MTPRFVIDTGDQNRTVTKSKYTILTPSEKLQAFLEMACYSDGPILIDPSDPDNRKNAESWFNNHLTFLGKRDAQDLRDVWEYAVEDIRNARLLFSAVKYLQEKYSNRVV